MMDFNQSWVIKTTREPSCVKVAKGHIPRSKSSDVKMKAENVKMVSFEKVKVRSEPNLVYKYNMGCFACSCSQNSYTKVKGYQRSSCKMGLNLTVKFTTFEKLKFDCNQTWFIDNYMKESKPVYEVRGHK